MTEGTGVNARIAVLESEVERLKDDFERLATKESVEVQKDRVDLHEKFILGVISFILIAFLGAVVNLILSGAVIP